MSPNQLALVGVLVVLVFMFFKCFMCMRKSGYKLSPEIIGVDPVVQGGDLNKLPYTMDCVPGPGKDASYYTKDLTPGGFCGDQKFVRDSMSYKITNGIGGSLLDK